MSMVFLNGEFMPADQARISPMDRGFLFADGIYEVIPAYGGTLFRLEDHLARLARSLEAIQLADPMTAKQWTELLEQLVQKNGGGNLAVYLQVTRGAPAKRDHAFPTDDVVPTVFAMCSPVAAPAADSPDTATGIAAITLDDIRWSRCDIKSVSLLPNIMLRQQAAQAGAGEAILLRDGFVTEGSASNVFVVIDGEICTPPRSHEILGGITRDLVIELCREHDLPVREREINETELRKATEIWVTSSTKEVVPVVQLNNQPVGDGKPGELWKTLARHYVRFKRRLCGEP
jgi:D-alanine transaminase